MLKNISNLAVTFLLILATGTSCNENVKDIAVNVTRLASEKCLAMSSQLKDGQMPRTFQGDTLVKSNLKAWTSGFFPGTCSVIMMLKGTIGLPKRGSSRLRLHLLQ